MSSNIKNVVVIGGGYAGIGLIGRLEKALDSQYRVILIEKRSHFYHSIAALRTTVESIENKVLIPYANALHKNSRFVQAAVTEIKKNEVHISPAHEEFGSVIPFEFAIIATGSTNPEPAKSSSNSGADISKRFKETREAVKNAQKILIIGGGAVGIELAGEIKTTYPKKEVTIIEKNNTLISNTSLPDQFKKKVKAAVEGLGIKVLLGESIIWDNDLGHDFKPRVIKTESGKELQSDLQFVSIGAKPNGQIIETLDSSLYNPETRAIKVKPTLQLNSPNYPNIYVIGDVADIPNEGKFAYKTDKQGETIVNNIQATIKKTPLVDYTGSMDLIVLTLGKNGGIAYLPFFGGLTLGNFLSKSLKSKDLFIGKYWKLLGMAEPKTA